jgi:hypothetical protein
MSDLTPQSMKDQGRLDIAAEKCQDAADLTALALELATTPELHEAVFKSQCAILEALTTIMQAGGNVGDAPNRERKRHNLRSLATLNTSTARELLDALENAVAIAERVDAERGRALPPHVPLGPNESRGTDLAEAISNLCMRLRWEVSPPTGRGE